MIGISVFPGLDINLEENLEYIKRAHNNGVEILFTSMHIPESNENKIKFEFEQILNLVKKLDMKLIVDISKEYISKYDWSSYHIFALRLDFGFSDEEIVALSKKYPIQLNASTISKEWMESLIKIGLNTNKISVCHNYYPRKDTGISIELLRERNRYFKSLNMQIMAFISSCYKKRGPIYEGLPTVEAHRNLHPVVGIQELLREQCDIIIIGDSMASDKELEVINKINLNNFILPVIADNMSLEEEKIFYSMHKNRMDPGEFIIRSERQTNLLHEKIDIGNITKRETGSVTIDNYGYKRYNGELQICKKEFPLDSKVNRVARVIDGGRLIKIIKEGDRFKFYKI